MVTKLEAARIALGAGTDMVITEGAAQHPLRRLGEGAPCTWFLATSDPVAARKRWIAGNLEPRGIIFVDAGAERALGQGKSLLPAGVVRVEGAFDRGDAVTIRALDGRDLGRGLIAYPNDEATAIMGKKSGAIATILGHAGRAELIHRDDMALNRTERT
jgi:glutamate 5-kinase